MQMGLDEFTVSNTQEKRTFNEEMERTARALNAANLAVYPVDARGLMGNPALDASSRGNTKQGGKGMGQKAMRGIQYTQDTMKNLAERTGGKAYINSNDLKGAIREAIEDSRATYTVGFYPTHNTWDGKFHELKVHTDRKGLNIRYRLGYYAFSDQPLTDKETKAAFQEALWSPLESTALGMTLRVAPNMRETGQSCAWSCRWTRGICSSSRGTTASPGGSSRNSPDVQQSVADKPPTIAGDAMDVNLKKRRPTRPRCNSRIR